MKKDKDSQPEGEEELCEWECEASEDDPDYAYAMSRRIFHSQNFPRPNRATFLKGFWNNKSARLCRGRSNKKKAATASVDVNELAPVWCFQRFGQSLTVLPDGRRVFSAGEHEDSYDPDFYIYNDVIVVSPQGEVEHIYGYPQATFPPTDHHAAVYVPSQNEIWIIGCMGYAQDRKEGETPVFKLSVKDWKISKVTTKGELPGWLSKATAVYDAAANTITLTGGKVFISGQPHGTFQNNSHTFVLSISTLVWRRVAQ